MPKKKTTKTTAEKANAQSDSKSRKLKTGSYKSFRMSKGIRPLKPKLPSAFSLMRQALITLKLHWKLFLGITVVYGILTVVLVRGIGGGLDLASLKTSLKDGLGGSYSSLATGATLFSYLVGSAGTSTSPTGGVYQTLLIIISSLAIIWSLRQVLAGTKIKVRDGFYRGMYPLIPFILVLLVVGLQLIPLLVGSWLYSTVVTNGIAINAAEKSVWGLLFFFLAVLSIYMICSSLFALYIVTLPDMTPLKALRSARQLVLYRRWTVIRKVLFLPFIILLAAAVIMIPLIIFATSLAVWIFFALSMFVLVIVHSYMYTLYRALL